MWRNINDLCVLSLGIPDVLQLLHRFPAVRRCKIPVHRNREVQNVVLVFRIVDIDKA